MMYQIVVDDEVVKEYEHKLQAIIWCIIKGYCYQRGNGNDRTIIGAKIKEVKDSFGKCDKSHFFPSKNVKG